MAFVGIAVAGDYALEDRDRDGVALLAEEQSLTVPVLVVAIVVVLYLEVVVAPVILELVVGPSRVDIFPGVGLAVGQQAAGGDRIGCALVAGVYR